MYIDLLQGTGFCNIYVCMVCIYTHLYPTGLASLVEASLPDTLRVLGTLSVLLSSARPPSQPLSSGRGPFLALQVKRASEEHNNARGGPHGIGRYLQCHRWCCGKALSP